jgi:hypothetical protein
VLDAKEIEALRERVFVLECTNIVLTERTPTSPRVLQGPGRFSQDDDGVLHFTLYARDVDLPVTSFFSPTPVGTIVSDTEYFSLEALDFLGRHWRADRVHLEEDHSMPLRFSVARGRVAPLHGWRDREPRESARFALAGYVFRKLDFPSNTRSTLERSHGRWTSRRGTWDVAEFEVDAVELHVHQEHDTSIVTARANVPLVPAYPSRLVEALRFVVGEEFWWDVLCEYAAGREQVTIYQRDPRRSGSVPAPIPTNYVKSFDHITELFACYLRFVLRATDPHALHPLSAEWGEVLRAGSGTLQTQATIFCICVEPLLRMLFTERRVELQHDRDALALVKRWTRRVRKMLKAEGCPEDLHNRFDGLFSRMSGLTDRERLAWLAARGAIDPALAEAWQRLRPVSAHGNRQDQGEDDPLYHQCMAVVGLMYQLVAHLIDYRGHLRAFAELGWPLRPYPLPFKPDATGDAGEQVSGER